MNHRELINEAKKLGKSVIVLGLGISGIECIKLLRSLKVNTIVLEGLTREKYVQVTKFLKNFLELEVTSQFNNEKIVFDATNYNFEISQISFAIISPGIPLSNPILKKLLDSKITIISEFEMGLSFITQPQIIITGSNGKTTTATLIDNILNQCQKKSFLCGNIGEPVVQYANKHLFNEQEEAEVFEYTVVEASSYQLEISKNLSPFISVFLNLSENHLERHGSIKEYFSAKKNLFINQEKNSYAVVNIDDEYGIELLKSCGAIIYTFGKEFYGKYDGAKIDLLNPSQLIVRINSSEFKFSLNDLKISGIHNKYNVASAILVALICDCKYEDIVLAINNFKGIKYRIEELGYLHDCYWINDSKSTSVASICVALETVLIKVSNNEYQFNQIILILGGILKKGNFENIKLLIQKNRKLINSVYCFGQDGSYFYNLLMNEVNTFKFSNIKNCLEDIIKKQKHKIILFSPGCSSFDEFKSFEERGRFFEEFIKLNTGLK